MIFLKIYLGSVIFWFLLIVITGLIFQKRFINGTRMILEFKGEEEDRECWIKTTVRYLFASFVPVYRLFIFVIKMYMTFKPEMLIEVLKEVERDEKHRFKNNSNGE